MRVDRLWRAGFALGIALSLAPFDASAQTFDSLKPTVSYNGNGPSTVSAPIGSEQQAEVWYKAREEAIKAQTPEQKQQRFDQVLVDFGKYFNVGLITNFSDYISYLQMNRKLIPEVTYYEDSSSISGWAFNDRTGNVERLLVKQIGISYPGNKIDVKEIGSRPDFDVRKYYYDGNLYYQTVTITRAKVDRDVYNYARSIFKNSPEAWKAGYYFSVESPSVGDESLDGRLWAEVITDRSHLQLQVFPEGTLMAMENFYQPPESI